MSLKNAVSVYYLFAVGLLLWASSVCADSTFPVWRVRGTDTHFQVSGAEGTISLDSSVAVTVALESYPNMLAISFEASEAPIPTQLTISGLQASATYFKSQDGYENQAPIAADASGSISFTQQVDARPHIVIIQPTHSTVHLRNDSTGGDCTTVGNWNSSTTTCTLSVDISGTVEIDSNGITLAGNHHTIDSGTIGVFLVGITGATIKDLTVSGFNSGIRPYNCNRTTVSNAILIYNGTGFYASESNYNVVTNSAISNNRYTGLYLDTFGRNNHDNSVTKNIVESNGDGGLIAGGIIFGGGVNNFVDSNIFRLNAGVGIWLGPSSNSTIINNISEGNSHEGLLIGGASSGNAIFHNDFVDNGKPPSIYPPTGLAIISQPLPIGGNHWSEYDTSAQGCIDANNDGICDSPYALSGGRDLFPWIARDGWAPPTSISSLAQYKSDGKTVIPEGGKTNENAVVFSALLQSSALNPLRLEVEYTTTGVAFAGIPNATSLPVSRGSVATAVATSLGFGNYRWRARVVDPIRNSASDWQELGIQGNTDFTIETLGDAASDLAQLVINDPYLGDGDTFGGKGWDPLQASYVSAAEIGSGYHYWNNNNKIRDIAFGAGLDCSGLIEWAFNRSFDPRKSLLHNVIRYDSADAQYKHNSEAVAEPDLKPGDLLFFGTSTSSAVSVTHVAMYVGDQGTFDVVQAADPRRNIIASSKDVLKMLPTFLSSTGFRRVVPSPAIGGSVKAGSPIDLVVTDPDGLTITATTAIQTSEEYLHEVPGELYYSENELGPDGRPEATIYWPAQKAGDYVVKAVPQAGVSPTSTYSLTFQSGSTTMSLAQNVPIIFIPSQGYGITVSAMGTISSFIPVAIDIKPGSYPNSINLGSNGVIPVAIFGSASFDVHQINPATITLANASIRLKGNGQPMVSYVDVNGDGYADIVIQVSTQALQLRSDDVKADLDGSLFDGTEVKGSDSVRVIPQ